MRIFTAIIFLLSYIGTSLSYAGPSCQVMFGGEDKPVIAGLLPAPPRKIPVIIEKVQSNSPRVELKKHTNSEAPEKLVIEELGFSEKTDEASIEMMRMLLQNSSYVLEEKNVLTKGELSIGIPVKDGYYFEVTYKSMSSERSQFIVDKITLRTPTGTGSKKVAEGFLKAGEVKLKKTEHEIGDMLGEGINAKIKIPLIIDGPLLNKIDKLSKFFEYFKKDELRKLLQTNSMLKIRTVFEYRRARDVFFKVLFKEPMKAAIGMGFILLATGISTSPINLMKHDNPTPVGEQVVMMAQRETGTYMQNKINGFDVPAQATQLKAEISEMNKQIQSFADSKAPYYGPNMSEISLDRTSSFSQQHQTWIFEKADAYNNSVHTYIVFAQEKSTTAGPGLQYMVMEISAEKYPTLIKFIKEQGRMPMVQQQAQGAR